MNIDNLTIGDAKRLAGMFGRETTARLESDTGARDGGVRIVILQRGWIVVGHVYEGDLETRVENAAVVRRWGTKKGLGEIAANGPLESTLLDDCGTVRAHPMTIVAQIDCNQEKWHGRL